jgi:hypothetical protein
VKTIAKQCGHCSTEFQASLKEHNRGYAKFCCKECCYKQQSIDRKSDGPEPNVPCAHCGTMVYRTAARQSTSRNKLYFCQRSCKDAAQRIGGIKEIMPTHYGTGSSSKTYRKIAFEHHPEECSACGWKEYPQVLHVHHIDRNRDNNRPENLTPMCPTCHEVEHLLNGDGRFWSLSQIDEADDERTDSAAMMALPAPSELITTSSA